MNIFFYINKQLPIVIISINVMYINTIFKLNYCTTSVVHILKLEQYRED